MIVALATIILLIFIGFTSGGRNQVTYVEGLISKSIAPVQKVLYSGSRYVHNFFTSIFEIGTLKETNKELQKEISELKQKQASLEDIQNENTRLSKLLDYQKANPQYDYIVADIVAVDPEVWFNVFTIDKGSDDGLKRNMPVVVSEGLVGKIVEVSKDTAKVLSISDASSMVNGIASRTGDYIRIKGNVDTVLEGNITPDVKLMPGDLIVTSGMGGIFPEGIMIGEVESVTKEKGLLEKSVMMKPAVEFKKLNEVLVLKKK